MDEDLKVAVDQPVGLEVVVVFSERVDQLLSHLHNGRMVTGQGRGSERTCLRRRSERVSKKPSVSAGELPAK